MKKLLSILSAVIVVSTSATSVIACDTTADRFTTPSISDKIKNEIIAEIQGDNSTYGKLTFGDIFNSSSDTQTLAVRLINQVVSQHFYGDTQNSWARTSYQIANSSAAGSYTLDSEQNKTIFKAWVKQIATDQLYSEYCNDYNNKSYFEYSMVNQGYSIAKQDADWHIGGIKALDGSYWTTNDTTGFETKDVAAVKAELVTRFADYYNHKLIPDAIDGLISEVYLNLSFLRDKTYVDGDTTKHEQSLLTTNPLLSNWQTWDSSTNQTNFKMVWNIKVSNSNSSVITAINNKIRDISKNTGDASITGNNITVNKMKSLVNFLGDYAVPNAKNIDQMGGDPIWGVSHFQGFAAFEKGDDGKLTNLNKDFKGLSDSNYETQLESTQNSGFLVNKTGGSTGATYNFSDGDAPYSYFVFVLPVYANDVLNNMSMNYGKYNGNKVKSNLGLYRYDETQTKGDFVDWSNYGGILSNNNNQEVNFIHDLNNDKEAGLGLYDQNNTDEIYDKKTGEFNSGQDTSRLELLKWAEHYYATDSKVTEAAKGMLYSMAFDSNQDNIYSQNLFNAISKYVTDNN